jgi:hypothetical protein
MLPFCAFELMAREGGSTLANRARAQVAAVGTGADVQLDAFIGAGISLAGAVALLLVSMGVVVLIVSVASVHALAALRASGAAPGEILKRGLKLSGKVLLAEILFDLALLALTLLPWSVGGIAALFVGDGFLQVTILVLTTAIWLVLVLTLYLRWVLFPQLIVIEGLGPIAALIRSAELMGPQGVRLLRGPKIKLSIILFIYWCVASVVQSTFLLPLGIVGFMEGIPLEEMPPPLAFVPLWVALPVAIVQVLTNSILYPIKAYLPTLFYFDLLARYGDLPGEARDDVHDDDSAMEGEPA